MTTFLEDVDYEFSGFTRVDDYRKTCSGGHFKLDSHYFLLLLDEFLGPVAVHADFSDGPYLT